MRTKGQRAKPLSLVQLIAFRGWETLFIAVRADAALRESDREKLAGFRKTLSHNAKVLEWRWPASKRTPIETEIR